MTQEATKAPRKKLSSNVVPTIFLIACGAVWFFFVRSSGFSAADVSRVQSSIKSEFEKKKDFRVTDVSMMKESSKRLIGYAHIMAGTVEITKSCTATMAEDDKSYMWECK